MLSSSFFKGRQKEPPNHTSIDYELISRVEDSVKGTSHERATNNAFEAPRADDHDEDLFFIRWFEACSPLEDRISGVVEAHSLQKEVYIGDPKGHTPESLQFQVLKKVCKQRKKKLLNELGLISYKPMCDFGVLWNSASRSALERCCFVMGIDALSSSAAASFGVVRCGLEVLCAARCGLALVLLVFPYSHYKKMHF
ncbi:hypothetical protein U1Q18_030593 [Sarracenia purpurea var. burkii]